MSTPNTHRDAVPPIESPAWDATAEAIGEALLHERAQLPPVVLGRCERPIRFGQAGRCQNVGLLLEREDGGDKRVLGATVFLCPRHGATLERAVRRYPR